MELNKDFKYTIYKTTNKINDKIYIGCHKTLNPNDDYIGSGTLLKRAIKKYGVSNFEKEVLFIFSSPQEMFDKEKEIVDKLFLESEITYNILEGGHGGFQYLNASGKNIYKNLGDETHGKQNLWKGNRLKLYLEEKGLWDDWKEKVSIALKKRFKENGFHWLGRKHKEETKRKIGKKLSIAQSGEKNSQYGKCWIYSDEYKQSKSISKMELNIYLEKGWKKGRKIKL